MATVRGWCEARDGHIHTDSKTKLITMLLYMNDHVDADRGRLRILRSPSDLNDMAAEVPADEGTLLVFLNGPNAWHGFEPISGPRRVIQINWVTDEGVVRREQARHRLSAFFKRLVQARAQGMPLRIETFRNDSEGSSLYKALSHPLAADPARTLVAKLTARGPVAHAAFPTASSKTFEHFLFAGRPPTRGGLYVQNIEQLERTFRGRKAEPVTALAHSHCKTLLIASFDEARALGQIRHLVPRKGTEILSFASLRLPADMLTDKARYLSTA